MPFDGCSLPRQKGTYMIDFKTITTPTFGPGGNGEWFNNEGGKATVQAPGWLKSKGLDAYEYEAGKGIMAGEGALTAIGLKAHEHGIRCNIFWSDDPDEAEKFLDMGVDCILTNDYLAIKTALEERGKL